MGLVGIIRVLHITLYYIILKYTRLSRLYYTIPLQPRPKELRQDPGLWAQARLAILGQRLRLSMTQPRARRVPARKITEEVERDRRDREKERERERER